MRLGCDISNLCNRFGDKKVFETFRHVGFDCVDYSFNEIESLRTLLDEDYVAKAYQTRQWMDEAGIVCNQTHAPFRFQYGQKQDCSEPNYRDVVRSMEFSAILGAPHIVIHAVTPPDSIDIFEYNRAYYRSFIPYCEKFGIRVAVENIARHHTEDGQSVGVFDTPEQFCDFIHSLNSPWFCACVDLGHAAIMNCAPEEFVLRMDSSLLQGLHVHDTDYKNDCHMVPYLQEHNWEAIMKALADIEYKGDFNLEILLYTAKFPDELVVPALQFAEQTGRYLINVFHSVKKRELQKEFFKKAVPVWEKGKEKEKNYTLLFRTVVEAGKDVKLTLTGASTYQIFVNHNFIGMGPARAAHGYYRVDALDLDDYLTEAQNEIVIEVAGYYINSFHHLEQPAFLCAEVTCAEQVLAATGGCGFEARPMKERMQKVQRYSYQRTFTEVYCMNANEQPLWGEVVLEQVSKKKYIPRNVYYPLYEKEAVRDVISCGEIEFSEQPLRTYTDRSLWKIGESLRGYQREELEVCSAERLYYHKYVPYNSQQELPQLILSDREYCTLTFGKNLSGIVGFEIECDEEVELQMTFDELLIDDDFGFRWDYGTANIVIWKLQPGTYKLLTFEPYTMQYVRFASLGGKCTLRDIHMRRYGYPKLRYELDSDDERLLSVYRAAEETFRQNVYDIYMDCPSRERAGWLCDAYFMARTEHIFDRTNQVERNFLENYIDCHNGNVPEGMLPMCYPADFEIEPEFIPQWALWFIIELKEYYDRTGDRKLIDKAKSKVESILVYFKKFENEDGMLERLDGEEMIEWSETKKFMKDVNFPTNMLYATALEYVAELYEVPEYLQKAKELREKILKMSYFDGFFHDHAIRQGDGSLEVQPNISECGQYFAFFFGLADKENFGELWNTLMRDFGMERRENNAWENIAFANAFVGNYLRMELLLRYGEHKKLLEDIIAYFYYMSVTTGTLWEHESTKASCNHGFASYVLYLLDKLGMLKPAK